MQNIIKVFENNHIDPPWAHVFVFALDVTMILAIAFCIREIRRARRAAAEADTVIKPGAPLFEGARFVAGTVELAQGETDAVRVTVTQDGSEHSSKNGTTHTWTEVERETRARPFYLRHGSGARIRVEPPEDVLLVDKLDQKEWHDAFRRRLRAELLPGEWAVVEGRLHKAPDPEGTETVGYRQANAMGWTMKPSPRKGMHVSTEDLSRRHSLRARAFERTCRWVVLLALLMNVPLSTYRARVFFGENTVLTYFGKTTYETYDSKRRSTLHYAVQVGNEPEPDATHYKAITIEIDEDDHNTLVYDKALIWMRVVPGVPMAMALGQGSSVKTLLWAIAGAIVGLALYRTRKTHMYRRWYESRVLEKGTGKLAAPTNERFLSDDPIAREERRARHIEQRAPARPALPIEID